MRRFLVLGTTGAGKTSLSRELAQLLAIPHIELDALRWDPEWTEAPDDVFRERVADALVGDAWVCDGNYGLASDIVKGGEIMYHLGGRALRCGV